MGVTKDSPAQVYNKSEDLLTSTPPAEINGFGRKISAFNSSKIQKTLPGLNEEVYPTFEGQGDSKTSEKKDEEVPYKNVRVGKIGGYVPKSRNLDEIYMEDELSKKLYSTVFEHDEDVKVTGAGSNISCMSKWTDIPLNSKILVNIERSGYIHPRKIQAYTIPLIFDGYDLKAQAETGSGKSAAFLIPLIHMVMEDKSKVKVKVIGVKNRPFAMIVEPTRELTMQLYEQAQKLAYQTGIRVVKCYGEYDAASNGKEVFGGCDIVVATPGRLMDFVNHGIIDVSQLKYFVLDEADRLVSCPDFIKIINRIRSVSTFPSKDKVQNLLFTATFPKKVEDLASDLLNERCAFVHNERTIATNSKIDLTFVECPSNEKKMKVVELLSQSLKEAQEKDPKAKQPRTLIFVERRYEAELMGLFLSEFGIRATTINGDRSQYERECALGMFRSDITPVLVATDVCARGLDIKDLDFVINMDLPNEIETFVHRIGRTGRIKEGKAVSLFDVNTDQRIAPGIVKILDEAKKNVPEFLRKAISAIPSSGFAPVKSSSGFAPVKSTSGFAPVKPTSGFAPVKSSSGFAPVKSTSGFAPIKSSSGFAPVKPTSGFAPVKSTSGFAPVKPTSRSQKNGSDAI